jgi:hypothetical protein
MFTPEVIEKMKKMLRKNHCLSGVQLKGRMPELATASVRRIQDVYHDDLQLISRKMAKRSPLTQSMMDQRPDKN